MRNPFSLDDLGKTVARLVGCGPDDRGLQTLLEAVGSGPVPQLAEGEYMFAYEDKHRGFALQFQDATTLKHPKVTNVTPRTPALFGAVYYSGGKEDYARFAAALPGGIVWSDRPEALETKLGEPKQVVRHSKTGALKAYRWEYEGAILTAGFDKIGKIDNVFVTLV